MDLTALVVDIGSLRLGAELNEARVIGQGLIEFPSEKTAGSLPVGSAIICIAADCRLEKA